MYFSIKANVLVRRNLQASILAATAISKTKHHFLGPKQPREPTIALKCVFASHFCKWFAARIRFKLIFRKEFPQKVQPTTPFPVATGNSCTAIHLHCGSRAIRANCVDDSKRRWFCDSSNKIWSMVSNWLQIRKCHKRSSQSKFEWRPTARCV